MKKKLDNKTYWRYGIVTDLDEDESYFAEVYLKNGKVLFYLPVGVLQIVKDFIRFIKDLRLQKKSKFKIYYLNNKFYSGDLKYSFCFECFCNNLFRRIKKGDYPKDDYIEGKEGYKCIKCGATKYQNDQTTKR